MLCAEHHCRDLRTPKIAVYMEVNQNVAALAGSLNSSCIWGSDAISIAVFPSWPCRASDTGCLLQKGSFVKESLEVVSLAAG